MAKLPDRVDPYGKHQIKKTATNPRGGGRPRGLANVLTRKKAEELAAKNETPLDVMITNMMWWHKKAEKLGKQIEKMVADMNDPEERAEALDTIKSFIHCREHSQKCAVDAAPYVHPRLQAIAVQTNAKRSIDDFSDEELLPLVEGVLVETSGPSTGFGGTASSGGSA